MEKRNLQDSILSHIQSLTDLVDLGLLKSASELEGDLRFDNLRSLSTKAAAVLSANRGFLALDGLTTLSQGVAFALSRHQGEGLSLRGLTSLSKEAASALAKHKGPLYFERLPALSDEVMFELAKHQGRLNGIGNGFRMATEISEVAAITLSKDDGLGLDNVTSLSEKAALGSEG